MPRRLHAKPSGPGLSLAAALGAAVFCLLHLVFTLTWERWFQPAELEVAWFLGSRRALITTQVVAGVVAALVGLATRRSWPRRLRDGAALAAGSAGAMAATFAAIGAESLLLGPARLWPMALVAGAVVLALPILAGTLAAGMVRRARWADGDDR